jgi:hypothetical protein
MSRPVVGAGHLKDLRDALNEEKFAEIDVKTEPHPQGEIVRLKAKHGGRVLELSFVCSEGSRQEHFEYQMAAWRRMVKRFVNPRRGDDQ